MLAQYHKCTSYTYNFEDVNFLDDKYPVFVVLLSWIVCYYNLCFISIILCSFISLNFVGDKNLIKTVKIANFMFLKILYIYGNLIPG